jgi:DNA sulfur modification protein DndE
MFTKQIRLSSQARDHLIRLKSKTGIDQWNVLCRWGLIVSLKEPTPPTPVDIPADSNVEMTWLVFGGEHHELYAALIRERCQRDGVEPSDENAARHFRLHLHRGISYLATPNAVKNIGDLLSMVLPKE